MQVQITARHFDATPTLRDYAEQRLSKLTRYYDGITDAHVIMGVDHETEKNTEITLNVFRQQLVADATAPTHEEAIDGCVERLRRQLLKYKSKLKSKDKDYVK